jgi:tetratricopeptide (TPR) repeat protein
MNTDFNLSELFDRYLENDLNILEKQAFELRLRNDSGFAERFRMHKEVDSALIEDDILNFRRQLEIIGTKNVELVQATPMVIAEELTPEIDQAILEQDIMALRDQLKRIHTSVVEEVDPIEITGYSGIEQAILSQDSLALNRELSLFEELVNSEEGNQDIEMSLFIQDVDKAILEEDVMMLRSKLEKIGEAAVETKKAIPLRRKVITYASSAVAAVFILVFAGSIFLNQIHGSMTSDKAISKYFQPSDVGVKRGPVEDNNKLMDNGINKYNKGEFANAIEWFETCLADTILHDKALFLTGTSHFLLGNYDSAIKYLGSCSEESLYIEESEWYIAGSYLKMNEMDKAKAILNKFAEDPDIIPYHNIAIDLLKTLSSR